MGPVLTVEVVEDNAGSLGFDFRGRKVGVTANAVLFIVIAHIFFICFVIPTLYRRALGLGFLCLFRGWLRRLGVGGVLTAGAAPLPFCIDPSLTISEVNVNEELTVMTLLSATTTSNHGASRTLAKCG